MSSVEANQNMKDVKPELKEPEPYVDAFPALGSSTPVDNTRVNGVSAKQSFANMAVKSSLVTQVFHVPLEERRFKNINQPFSSDTVQQAQVCQQITKNHDVQIETNLARDQSLTVVVTGRSDNVLKARRDIINKLQTQAQMTINIPKEHHRFLLGKSGKKLAELELETATKILVPRQEENSDEVRVTGIKEGIDKAMHEIQLISDEQAKLAFERLTIPYIYHPFIVGADKSRQKKLQDKTGARINVPPPSVMKDELTVAGEKDGVHQAVLEINQIYNEKKQKCQTVSVEVNKKQHKYVIGPRGTGIQEILGLYDVSVEVPSADSSQQTITLRGEPQALGQALSLVYAKANSVISDEVPAPSWLHRFIIGKQGSGIKKLMTDLPKVHIEFTEGEDKICLEGPPEEVESAKKQLEAIVAELKRTMDFCELQVNKKYHRNIIGKSGQNRQRLMAETNTNIRIPNEEDSSDIIRVEGDPAGVKKVKAELMEMVKKMDNEKTRDILIEQRFHKQIIGQKGENIKDIRGQFNQVQITLPDSGKKSDVVTLRGPREDVDRCYKYLEKMHKEMIVNNYHTDVHIFKDFHKNIIGKGGATIKKIRDETNTKIDLPNQLSDSDAIRVTGKRENVEKARDMIEKIQKELANIAEEHINIPSKLHNAVIGAKGRFIRAIMNECGGVIIRFPVENSNSDKVVIRGPKSDVENAKKQLIELVEDRKVNNYTGEIKAKPEFHKFLIGRGGVNIRKVRDKFGARVIFPSSDDEQPDLITIIGKQEAVEAAREDLQRQIQELENVVEEMVDVPVKWHKNFVARRGEMLNQIADEYGGVSVSFPRSGSDSEAVKLNGARNCVEGAKQRILEIVADLEAMVSLDCVIPQKYHRQVMGARGANVQEITKQYNVQVKFPDRPRQEPKHAQEPAENGVASHAESGDAPTDPHADEVDVAPSSPTTEDPALNTIVVTGKKDMAEEAVAALLALVPVTKEISIPFEFHRYVIGMKGKDIRYMMEQFDVNISIPHASQESDAVKVSGSEPKVDRTLKALAAKVEVLEKEKADKALRSFQLEMRVDPKHHPKIIGRRGAVISKIRKDNQDVQVQFPERKADEQDKIIITGYEASAAAARDAIQKIVDEIEAMTTIEVFIDSRIHNRIIGGRGAQIRRIMDEFKVEVKFPRPGDEEKDRIEISGDEDACYDCKDELLNLAEEYMQDVLDREETEKYVKPSRQNMQAERTAPKQGFVVKDAPWNMASTDDFPTMGSAPATNNSSHQFGAWGKK